MLNFKHCISSVEARQSIIKLLPEPGLSTTKKLLCLQRKEGLDENAVLTNRHFHRAIPTCQFAESALLEEILAFIGIPVLQSSRSLLLYSERLVSIVAPTSRLGLGVAVCKAGHRFDVMSLRKLRKHIIGNHRVKKILGGVLFVTDPQIIDKRGRQEYLTAISLLLSLLKKALSLWSHNFTGSVV